MRNNKISLFKKKRYEIFKKWKKKNLVRWKKLCKEWREKNPDKMKKYKRKAYYKAVHNITPEQFDEMLKKQKGRCAICQRKVKRTLHIDHCHKSKKKRGLLCDWCNRNLGWLESVTIAAIIRYLKQYEKG